MSKRVTINEQKQFDLYHAIHDEIMDVRVAISLGKIPLTINEINDALLDVELRIWRKQAEILGVEE